MKQDPKKLPPRANDIAPAGNGICPSTSSTNPTTPFRYYHIIHNCTLDYHLL